MGSDELFTGSASNSGFGSAALNGEYIVHEYGATGNGTTDDTAAIQATVMAAQALGGTVVFPPGTYRITATINVTNHCTILGRGGVIHPNIPDTNAGQVFYVSGSYVTFQSLKFDYLGLQTGCE